jgi:hypothetical protein
MVDFTKHSWVAHAGWQVAAGVLAALVWKGERGDDGDGRETE